MSTEIWGLASCDTCRKARKALPGAVFRDIRVTPLTEAERADLLARFGDRVINRSSTTWRGLSEAERLAPAAELLARHPALCKRPVIRSGEAWYLGFGPAERAALGVGPG